MKKTIILFILLLQFATPCPSQSTPVLDRKNSISLGGLARNDLATFYTRNRNYAFFAEYKRLFKYNIFVRSRIVFFSESYGTTAAAYTKGPDTYAITWIENDLEQSFYFKDNINFDAKKGIKSTGAVDANTTEVGFCSWVGYTFYVGKKKKIRIEPSIGGRIGYYRKDYYWLDYPIKIGNPLEERRVKIFNTTRGLLGEMSTNLAVNYAINQRYDVGLDCTIEASKRNETWYYGCFLGFKF